MSAPSFQVPIDQAARDTVRDAHGVSLFVEAGAGTGKTTALVDRVVALVAAGEIQLRELAAITFTEAAAAELRDRIRGALERAAAGSVDTVVAPDARDRCRAALDQLDEAALTTLHGFGQRLLTEHPLEAGLPPGFEVLDDIRAGVAFEQRWRAFLDDLFEDPTLRTTLLTGLSLGLRFDHLRNVAKTLHDHIDRIGTPPEATPLPPVDLAPLAAALDEIAELRSASCAADDDKLAQHIDRLGPYRATLDAPGDRLDQLERLVAVPKLTFSHGKSGNWDCDISDVKAACARADELRVGLIDGQRLAVLSTLVARVVQFVQDHADERRREGTLEFHDLLVLARNLLRDDPAVRDAAARRWRCVLLDEFQDTDPLQIQLAVLLATSQGDAGTLPWQDVPIDPGALVVVGDPKQSIYRFRRADLGMYHEAQHRLGLTEIALVENFRSVPGVLDFVNRVFGALLPEEDPGVQAAHVDLHHHRSALNGAPAVAIVGGPVDEKVAEVRAAEAADVAAIVQAVKREAWPVEDVGDHVVRGAEYQDIAILIPSRTVLPGLEDALERAGIPVRVESQSLLFSTAEVRDLLSILAAIDDPSDEISIVAALRSPAFGCSDADLADFVEAHGRWDYRVAAPASVDARHPVVAGLAALHEFWDQRWWRSVSETVEAVVRERRLLELAVEKRRPRDHWRRIRYLLDQARAWDDAGQPTLRSFVEWAKEQAEERARVVESVAPEPDDDAVRILTIHGSKGLEFPVVVLAGLSVQPPNSVPAVVWDRAGTPQFMIGTKASSTRAKTPGYDDAAAAERRHDEAERLRLLYVAMTRARDHLVVSLHHKEGSRCHASSVSAHLEGAPVRVLVPGDPAPAVEAPPVSEPELEPAAHDAWVANREAFLTSAGRPRSIAATTLAKATDEKDEPPSDAPPWRRGRAGTAVGRAVHAVLQTVDLATGADVAAAARAQALGEGVAGREQEVRDLVEAVLRAPIVRAAVERGRRYWREVPVAAEIDGLLLEGFIDLLVETDDGLVVVDYKTDRVDGDADVDAAVQRYGVQGAAYAVALEAVLGQPVTRCVFVFARTGDPLEREVDDLDAAKAVARERLAAAANV
jgi:ATP-dependent helicase/nuclease subunit A